MKKKPLGKGKYVKAKTQEAKQKQRAAIIGYYTKKRAEEKKKLWNYVDAYWMKNAGYAYEMIKLLQKSNEQVMITGLIEDGMFEAQIHMAAALYGEMMWDTQSDLEELKLRVSLRKDT